jgi:cytochrome c oxidase subunit 2
MPFSVRRAISATLVTSVAALASTAAAYAGNAGFLPASPHSPNAKRVTDAFIFVSIFTGVVFLIVEGALILFIVKYRRGKRAATAEGPQIHGSTRLEILWTVVPVLILAGIGTFVFYKLPGIADAPKAAAADQTTIDVEGHQFYWLFRYPNGAISIDQMVAPADQVVHENVIGLPWDVNHSWWVPELGGKWDAIPGKTNKTWFQAPVGSYVARCAELCGVQHALMDATVNVVPPGEYAAFIQKRASPAGTMALGKEEWQGVCEKCHRLDHQYIGPALGGNPLLKSASGIESLLRNGESGTIGVMPAVGKNWTPHQIDALIAYTKTLPAGGSG